MSITRRIRSNAITGVIGKLLVAANQLLLIPFFLRAWGAEYFGEWLMLSAIPTTLSTANLGLGTAAATAIIHALGSKDTPGANKILLTSTIASGIICTLLVALVALVPVSLLHEWKFLGSPQATLVFLFATLALGIITQPLEGIWVADNHAARSFTLRNILQGTILIGSAIVLAFGGTALQLAMTRFAITGIWVLFYGSSTWRLLREVQGMRFCRKTAFSLATTGAGFQLAPLWQAILFQGSLWIANAALGSYGPAIWGTVRTFSRAGNQLLSVINQSIMPELQNAVASKNMTLARKIHSVGVVSAIQLGILAAAGVCLVAPWGYPLWTGKTLDVPWVVWPILSAGLILNATWWTSNLVHRAFNMPWQMNITGVFAAILACGIMYILGPLFGVTGFALGALAFDAIMSWTVFRRSVILLDDSKKRSLLRGVDISLNSIRAKVTSIIPKNAK